MSSPAALVSTSGYLRGPALCQSAAREGPALLPQYAKTVRNVGTQVELEWSEGCLSSRHRRPGRQSMSQDIVDSHWRWGHGSGPVPGRGGRHRWRESNGTGQVASDLPQLAVPASGSLSQGRLWSPGAQVQTTEVEPTPDPDQGRASHRPAP